MPSTERQQYNNGKHPEGNGWYITKGSGERLTRQQIKKAAGDIYWERLVKTPQTQKNKNVAPKNVLTKRHRLQKGLTTYERSMLLRHIKREEEMAKKRGMTYKYSAPKLRKTRRKPKVNKKFKEPPIADEDDLANLMEGMDITSTPDHYHSVQRGLEVRENSPGPRQQSNESINREITQWPNHTAPAVAVPDISMIEATQPVAIRRERTPNRSRPFRMALEPIKKQR
jgi:hypothetical protein